MVLHCRVPGDAGTRGVGKVGIERKKKMAKSLYENIINKDFDVKDNKGLHDALDKSEIFFIDNVAKYFYESEQDEWDIDKDFPNLAPPFENFFMEYKVPDFMRCQGTWGKVPKTPGAQVGILFCSQKAKGNEYPFAWIYALTYFTSYSDTVRHIPVATFLYVDKNGVPIKPLLDSPSPIQHLFDKKDLSEQEIESIWTFFVDPALLAISFLHCKNVKIVPQGHGLYSGSRNRHKPSIRYHVLEIDPMKETLRTEGKSDETGLKKAMHICRGHFKDYRDGRGLFGKFKDIYWWDSQVRGDILEGLVTKNYQINQPN